MPVESLSSIFALTKTASWRAAGLCYDEVAFNTKMLQDFEPQRKRPALLKVMAGSIAIKMLVIPAALALNALAPALIVPLLAVGGVYLCAEGTRHMLGKHEDHDHGAEHGGQQTQKDFEKSRIRKVLTIDGMLSVEITVMTLGVVAGLPALTAAGVLALTGVIRTTWMYSLIGSIVHLPNAGNWLVRRKGDGIAAKAARKLGNGVHKSMPYIIKGFSIAGTVALLAIGGGLVLHGIPGGAHMIATAAGALGGNVLVQGVLSPLLELGAGMLIGLGARPMLDAAEKGIRKIIAVARKPLTGVFKHKTSKHASPQPEAGKDALRNVADVKIELNAAAEPKVKDAPVIETPKPPSPPSPN